MPESPAGSRKRDNQQKKSLIPSTREAFLHHTLLALYKLLSGSSPGFFLQNSCVQCEHVEKELQKMNACCCRAES